MPVSHGEEGRCLQLRRNHQCERLRSLRPHMLDLLISQFGVLDANIIKNHI